MQQTNVFVPEFVFDIETIITDVLKNSSVPELQEAADVITQASTAMTDAEIDGIKTQLQAAERELGLVNKDYGSLRSPDAINFGNDAETAFNAANPVPKKPGVLSRGATKADYAKALERYDEGLRVARINGADKYRAAETAYEGQKAQLDGKKSALEVRIASLTSQSQSQSREATYQAATSTLDAYVRSIDPFNDQRGQRAKDKDPINTSLSKAQLGQQYIAFAAELAKSGAVTTGQAATGATSALQVMVQTAHESLEDDVRSLEPQLRLEAAKLYIRGGSYADALTQLSKVKELAPVSTPAANAAQEAPEAQAAAPKQVITSADIAYLSGISQLRTGKLEEANTNLLDAYKSNPNMRGTVPLVEELVAAQAKADVGKAVGMLDAFKTAGAFDADGSNHLLLRVAKGLQAEDANRAYETASKINNRTVGGRASELMGDIKAEAKDLVAAVSNYRASILVNPFDSGYVQKLRETYIALAEGSADTAIDMASLGKAGETLAEVFRAFRRNDMVAAEKGLTEGLVSIGYQRYDGSSPDLETAMKSIGEKVKGFDENRRLAIAVALHSLSNIAMDPKDGIRGIVLGLDPNKPSQIGLVNEALAVYATKSTYQHAALAANNMTPLK